ncbi:unnamed protein product, partial [Staurois parvus]
TLDSQPGRLRGSRELIYCRGNWLFSFLIYSLSLFWDLEPGDFKEICEG